MNESKVILSKREYDELTERLRVETIRNNAMMAMFNEDKAVRIDVKNVDDRFGYQILRSNIVERCDVNEHVAGLLEEFASIDMAEYKKVHMDNEKLRARLLALTETVTKALKYEYEMKALTAEVEETKSLLEGEDE